MKSEIILALALIIIICSTGAVAACENITSDDAAEIDEAISSIDGESEIDEDISSIVEESEINEEPPSIDEDILEDNEPSKVSGHIQVSFDSDAFVDSNNDAERGVLSQNNFSYTIAVNCTQGTVDDVIITSKVPEGLQYLNHGTNKGKYNSTTGVWNVSHMSEGEVCFLTILTKVTATEGEIYVPEDVQYSFFMEIDSEMVSILLAHSNFHRFNVIPLAVYNFTQGYYVINSSRNVYSDDSNVYVSFISSHLYYINNSQSVVLSSTHHVSVNCTQEPVYDMVVNFPVPQGLFVLDYNVSVGSYNKTDGVWNISSLSPGDFEELSVLTGVLTVNEVHLNLNFTYNDGSGVNHSGSFHRSYQTYVYTVIVVVDSEHSWMNNHNYHYSLSDYSEYREVSQTVVGENSNVHEDEEESSEDETKNSDEDSSERSDENSEQNNSDESFETSDDSEEFNDSVSETHDLSFGLKDEPLSSDTGLVNESLSDDSHLGGESFSADSGIGNQSSGDIFKSEHKLTKSIIDLEGGQVIKPAIIIIFALLISGIVFVRKRKKQ